ncbi:hypothetical protein BG015_000845, partial [Linnemannia schmuckeri]
MTVSLDQKTITIWNSGESGSVTNYSLSEETWKPIYAPRGMLSSEKQLKAEVDPSTGDIYVPWVYDPHAPTSSAAVGGKAPQAVVEPEAATPSGVGRANGIVMPDAVKAGATGYSWVWLSNRTAFFLCGGRVGEGAPDASYLHEFKPHNINGVNSGIWSILSMSGTVPPRLIGSCMLPAYNGTKIILFGGHEMDAISKNIIYILDIPSMTWTKDSTLDPGQSRSYHGCSVSGDNFIAWGGLRGLDGVNSTKPDVTPLIFNLYSFMWVSRYERGMHFIPPPVAPAPSDDSTAFDDKNKGAIIGGSVGAAIIVLAIASVVYVVFKRPDLRQHVPCLHKNEELSDRPSNHGEVKVALDDIERGGNNKDLGYPQSQINHPMGEPPQNRNIQQSCLIPRVTDFTKTFRLLKQISLMPTRSNHTIPHLEIHYTKSRRTLLNLERSLLPQPLGLLCLRLRTVLQFKPTPWGAILRAMRTLQHPRSIPPNPLSCSLLDLRYRRSRLLNLRNHCRRPSLV